MAKRSLQASTVGIQQAKRAFATKGWTQENLAEEVSIKTRQPIWRFFTGRTVDRQVFMEICSVLDLDWREIAQDPPDDLSGIGKKATPAMREVDRLVQKVRSQIREDVQNQCGILQLLDVGHPVSINDIYVDVNILEQIPSQQHLAIADLQKLGPKDFNRVGLGDIKETQVSGIQSVETYDKLRILGRPGVGKTTFLKYLAIQCNQGDLAVNQVPIFIFLREFAAESRQKDKFSLSSYLDSAKFIDTT